MVLHSALLMSLKVFLSRLQIQPSSLANYDFCSFLWKYHHLRFKLQNFLVQICFQEYVAYTDSKYFNGWVQIQPSTTFKYFNSQAVGGIPTIHHSLLPVLSLCISLRFCPLHLGLAPPTTHFIHDLGSSQHTDTSTSFAGVRLSLSLLFCFCFNLLGRSGSIFPPSLVIPLLDILVNLRRDTQVFFLISTQWCLKIPFTYFFKKLQL